MAGHSKWNNIKRRKEKTDSQKGKIFTKMGREIAVAVREGGADPSSNGKLRDVIAKAKANNLPNENIERAIKKASAAGEQANYENNFYEGYGPSGVAVIVETLTDNKNRTAADLRHYFDKYGGNLGQPGSVSFMFARRGLIIPDMGDSAIDEERIMEDAFETGAEDYLIEDGLVEIYTDPNGIGAVREALEKKGYAFLQAEVSYIPSTMVELTEDEHITKMNKLLDMLEDNDDVQNVWHNWAE